MIQSLLDLFCNSIYIYVLIAFFSILVSINIVLIVIQDKIDCLRINIPIFFTIVIFTYFSCIFHQEIAYAEDPELYAPPEDLVNEDLLAAQALLMAAIAQGDQNENPAEEGEQQQELPLLENLLAEFLQHTDSDSDEESSSIEHPINSGENPGEGASGEASESGLLGLIWGDYEEKSQQAWPEHTKVATLEITSLLQKSVISLDKVNETTIGNRVLSRMCRSYGDIWLRTVMDSLQQELSQLAVHSGILKELFIQKRLDEMVEQKSNQQQLLAELHEVLEAHPQAQGVIQAQEELLQLLTSLIQKLEALLESIHTDNTSGPPKKGGPPGSPPPPAGGVVGFSPSIQEANYSLGYSLQGEISSLQGMQCLLLDTSEQVSNTLRTLVLKTKSLNILSDCGIKRIKRTCKNKSSYMPLQNVSKYPIETSSKISSLHSQVSLVNLCHVITQLDSYTLNLEYKLRSAKVGFLMNPMDMFTVGLTYQHHQNTSKEFSGLQKGWSFGAAKATTNTDSLAAIIAWNPNSRGFSAYLSGCCGWGVMKNTRMVTHLGMKTYAKGNPKLTLHGGLIQFGYNFQIADRMLFTPYVESMFVSSKWSPYEEISGLFPARISGNSEQVLENAIGVNHSWSITDSVQLQTWVARGIKKHIIKELSSEPLINRQHRYTISVPKIYKQYLQSEVGLSYEHRLLETLSIRLDSIWRFYQQGKDKEYQTGVFLQYRL